MFVITLAYFVVQTVTKENGEIDEVSGVKYRALALFTNVLGFHTGWVIEGDNWIPGAASAALGQLVREVSCSKESLLIAYKEKLGHWDQLVVAVEAHGADGDMYPMCARY